MKILITGPGTFEKVFGDDPIVGNKYYLEDATHGTEAQNKASHALIQEYFRSGCFSDNAANWLELKDLLKKRIGQGFDAIVYVDPEKPEEGIKMVKRWEDVPEHVRAHPDKKKLARGRLKSWSEYTKRQRQDFIDNLISEMHQTGVTTKKFYEILEGMDQD